MMSDDKIKEKLQKYFMITGSISIENRLVSCGGDVILKNKIKGEGLPVKFKSVNGLFDCSHNKLTSLAGAPQTVGGGFYCTDNQLTSLAGAPQSVGGHFICDLNQLTSLAGAPQTVGGDFNCISNPLSSLTGAPKYVGKEFRLPYAKNLALLPLLKIQSCQRVLFLHASYIEEHKSLSAILNRYLGTGTRGMLPCAMEMIKAGYGSNARL